MEDETNKFQGIHPPSPRGHPLPRRTSPEKSVTLFHHRLARDASKRESPGTAPSAMVPVNSSRRNSSGESHATGHSDNKRWFDQSNRNPTATFDATSMDVDPPFFQKETDSSNEDLRDPGAPHRNPTFPFAPGAPQAPHLHHAATRSSSADDYRSVIDDLTIENKRLKEELKRYKQFGPDMMQKEKLFEIKVHGLPKRKKRELEITLREFAAGLEASSESPSQSRKTGRHGKNVYSSGESRSKHASSSSSHSRPVDSAYASMSTGPSSHAPHSVGASLGRPSIGSRAKSSSIHHVENYLRDTPDGLLPRHLVLTDKERKKLVVRRLEQLFTGKIGGKDVDHDRSTPFTARQALSRQALSDLATMAPPGNTEASREARIQLDPGQKKPRSGDNMSTSNSNGDQTESGGNGDGSRSGGRSGNNTSPPTTLPPDQRPTRPLDLDPDRVQVPSENMEYIRHLGLVPPEFLVEKKSSHQDVSPDAEGWVYLNLLCNLAQLHMINVTPGFIRSAVNEKSTKFQLSPDGRKIRWRGGTDGTRFSSDSSSENSQKSPSTDDTDESNESGQKKKIKTPGGDMTLGASSKDSKFGPQTSSRSQSFHYKPLFVHQSSSMESSLEGTGSQLSEGILDESNLENAANLKWDYSGSGSSQRKKRRHDGAIIYYSGAPFCTDLSGDPGEVSPSTYLTSTGQKAESSARSLTGLAVHRTQSGSSLVIRPLSDSRTVAHDIPGMESDNLSDLLSDAEESLVMEEPEFPWCDNSEKNQPRSFDEAMESCGLGGVIPEDHFTVVVNTRRMIGFDKTGTTTSAHRARSEDIAEAIAARLASMRTSSPLPPPRQTDGAGMPIGINYLSRSIRQLKPTPLPPPAIFFPPFSTDSDTDSDDEDDDLESGEEGMSGDSSLSKGLISQLANPHHSEINYPEHDEDLDLQSGDEGVDNSALDDDEVMSDVMGSVEPRRELITTRRISSASTGKRLELLHTGSSVATAGGAESGYSSSMEEDAS
ncbi:frequency clock protein [Podospora didyma]|uniref:Frequency clock protein n=1 Tax=Podospora didyma TaxID=330526 RepID=A0AAE0NNX2_9PEZI|nr:frequency clock protein [Podospora didyma]